VISRRRVLLLCSALADICCRKFEAVRPDMSCKLMSCASSVGLLKYGAVLLVLGAAGVFLSFRYVPLLLGPATSTERPWVMFGRKTSYVVNYNPDTSPPIESGCSVALHWHFGRHGARYPYVDEVEEMHAKVPIFRDKILRAAAEGQSKLSAAVLAELHDWRFNFAVKDGALLTETGFLEHVGTGERWSKRLDGLIVRNENTTEVIASDEERCIQSARGLLAGLGLFQDPIRGDNNLLRFLNECKQYRKEVTRNPDTDEEYKKFARNPLYLGVMTNVESLTGVRFSPSDLNIIWELCRFEVANDPTGRWPTWCNLFSPHDLAVFDFRENMKYAAKDGYHYPITRLAVQPLWENIISRFEDLSRRGKADNNTVLVIGNTASIEPFLASLGLYNDRKNLTASDWPGYDLKWRIGKIAGFAASVDLLVYSCPAIKSNVREFKVALFHQEHRKRIPGLASMDVSLDEFLQHFRHLADINYTALCHNKKAWRK